MNINERIITLRKALNNTQLQFATLIGVPRTSLIGWEKGKTVPFETVEKILHSIPKLNREWILTEEGQMFHSGTFEDDKKLKNNTIPDSKTITKHVPPGSAKPADEPSEIAVVHGEDNIFPAEYRKALWGGVSIFKFDRKSGLPEKIELEEASENSFVFVPVFSQRAAAGKGQEETQLTETEGTVPVMLSLFGIHRPAHCGIAQAMGDSMIDVGIFSGDWCLFDMDDRRGDGIFFITMFGETRIKRLYYRLVDRTILIASENQKRYPDPEKVSVEMMETGQLIVQGRVFALFRKMVM
jgi:SOS-response transcriptional repressor LexA